MKASNVIMLSRWVEANRPNIGSSTLGQLAEKASTDLKIKVPVSALGDVLRSHGIATRRRSETAIKIEQLTEQRDNYREWLLRCIDAVAVQDWLLDEMQGKFRHDQELTAAIRNKRKLAVR